MFSRQNLSWITRAVKGQSRFWRPKSLSMSSSSKRRPRTTARESLGQDSSRRAKLLWIAHSIYPAFWSSNLITARHGLLSCRQHPAVLPAAQLGLNFLRRQALEFKNRMTSSMQPAVPHSLSPRRVVRSKRGMLGWAAAGSFRTSSRQAR